VDPDKICNKLVCGDYDYWWPVLTENGSPPWLTFGQNTWWAKNFPCVKNGRYTPARAHTCNYSAFVEIMSFTMLEFNWQNIEHSYRSHYDTLLATCCRCSS